MAYKPRTPQDANRLAAAAAELPAVAAQVQAMMGNQDSNTYNPHPTTQRLATVADAPALGVTAEDIMRMQSNPGRYGPIYAQAQAPAQPRQEARSQPKKTAVNNDKRTQTRQKADGTKKSPPQPPKRPTDTDTGVDIPWGPLLTALGVGAAGAGARALMNRKQVPGEAPRQLEGPRLALPPAARTPQDVGIEDAIWRDVPKPTIAGAPVMPAVAGGESAGLPRIPGTVAPPPPPMADPRAPIVGPDLSAPTDETFRRQQQALTGAITAPEPTTSDIIKAAQGASKPRKLKGRKPRLKVR